MLRSDLTPNQFVLLHCLREGIIRDFNFNKTTETKALKEKGYLNNSGEVIKQVLDEELQEHLALEEKIFTDYTRKFMQIFPIMRLRSGYSRPRHLKTVRDKLKAFTKLYDYDWDIIFQAAENYVANCAKSNYKYMQTCANFVLDNEGGSTLSLECDLIKANEVHGETV